MPHSCLIGIGSNHNRQQNIQLARERLEEMFEDIRFGVEMETLPQGLSNPAPFTNVVAAFSTMLEPQTVKRMLKSLEAAAGRTPEQKQQEIIALDVDLLKYDQTVLKPRDMKQTYIMEGIKTLPHE